MRQERLQRQLGDRIAKLRRRRGMSAVELSDASGIHKSYISAIENGHANPTLKQLYAIARGLECALAILLMGVDQK